MLSFQESAGNVIENNNPDTWFMAYKIRTGGGGKINILKLEDQRDVWER